MDRRAFLIYTVLISIGVVSILVAFFVQGDSFQALVALPGVGALLGVVYQLLRDEAAHHRQLELQTSQQNFVIGAASHMANVAFDKHVEFCEKYMKEVHAALLTLFREGPTRLGIDHSRRLLKLREEYAAWLTSDLIEDLTPFEITLRRIGAGEIYISHTAGSADNAERRSRMIEEVHKSFLEVLDIKSNGEVSEDHAVEAVKSAIRDILGIQELTAIRKALIGRAVHAIERGA